MVLVLRGWVAYELASRMKSDKPMVELLDPSGKVVELYLEGKAAVLDFFAAMQTTFPEDKELIQEATRVLFAQGASAVAAASPELNFNRQIADMLHFTGGKRHIQNLVEDGDFQVGRARRRECCSVGGESGESLHRLPRCRRASADKRCGGVGVRRR